MIEAAILTPSIVEYQDLDTDRQEFTDAFADVVASDQVGRERQWHPWKRRGRRKWKKDRWSLLWIGSPEKRYSTRGIEV